MYIHLNVYVCFFFFPCTDAEVPKLHRTVELMLSFVPKPSFQKIRILLQKKNVLYIVHEIVIGYHTSDAFSQDYIFFSLFYLPYFGHIPQITLCYSKTFSVKGCGRED